MYIFCLLVALIIILLLFMYRLFSSSNSINEDNNILPNKINDLENYNQDSLDLFNNYERYRLGDAFYLTTSKKHWNTNINNNLDFFVDKYKNKILSEYVLLSNYKENDWDSLIEIVNNKFYRDININKSTDCLMHVRVGDVTENCSDEFLNVFYKNKKPKYKYPNPKYGCRYIKPLKYFQQKIKKLIEMGITKVYLMAGAHIKLPSYKYSTYYINKIVEEIEKVGLQVELKLGGSPDDDLLFSMNFGYFIPSGGQYSRLIKELNEKINPDFTII